MVDGLATDPEAFPDIEFQPDELADLLEEVKATQAKRQEREVLLKEAIAEEQERMRSLAAAMRERLDQAEAVHRGEPEELAKIGWGTRRSPTFEPPNQPRELSAVRAGAGSVELRWKSPPKAVSGRTLRFYRIERRKMSPGEDWQTDCVYATTALRLMLDDQPRNVELEYRVVAVNPHGDSAPTNTVAIVA
jgi:hypothetical protein